MSVSSLCLLFGALLIGDALHGSIVTGQYAITSPAAVFRLLVGIVALGIGYRLRVPPEDRMSVSWTTDRRREDTGEDEEFDIEESPFDEESMERLAEREKEREREDN